MRVLSSYYKRDSSVMTKYGRRGCVSGLPLVNARVNHRPFSASAYTGGFDPFVRAGRRILVTGGTGQIGETRTSEEYHY